MTAIPDFNAPEFQRDLYGNYARLRAVHPVHCSEFRGGSRYSLLTYDAVVAGFRDPRLVTSCIPPAEAQQLLDSGHEGLASLARFESSIFLLKDPPDHTRLRGLVSRAFTPRRVDRLRRRVAEVTEELLDAAQARGELEFVGDFAVPLPLIAIAELLGVPTADRDRLKRWSSDIAKMLDRTLQAEGFLRAGDACNEAGEYFRRLLAERRDTPRDDLISALVAARDAEDRLSENELLATCLLLLGAGHETITNLLANGLLALLENPKEVERLRARPQLLENTIEELLRYDSPVQRTVRRTAEPIELSGTRIPKGEIVDLVIGAANRDPSRFPEPDRLDLTRADNRHVAFGGGIHFCPGAALARLEAQVAIASVLRRFPALKLATEAPERKPGNLMRALRTLPVAF